RGHKALQQQTLRDPKYNNNNKKNYLYLAATRFMTSLTWNTHQHWQEEKKRTQQPLDIRAFHDLDLRAAIFYFEATHTVAANPLGMAFRTYHLGVAAMAGNAATHCPYAAQDATGPCATEVLKSVNCSLYASLCSGATAVLKSFNCSLSPVQCM
ncbi:unnamed protein product, partial [Polarella glacialis]